MFAAGKSNNVAASNAANYIEDVFSTYLYTGTGATQTITNNIDLSTKGGMVWIKDRTNAYNNNLFDTAQGATKVLHSNTTGATVTDANSLTAFGTTGFTLGSGNTSGSQVNTSTDSFASWTFRKQAKFFDIVSYTGNGTSQNISHNLGSVPGCIIIKATNGTATNWIVWHTSTGSNQLILNGTNAAGVYSGYITCDSSTFTLTNGAAVTNYSGISYIAYLFASNAGGFGSAGTDNVITCGSFTTDGSGNATVNLGYEPQWVLSKYSSSGGAWYLMDNMRGMDDNSNDQVLNPNSSAAESSWTGAGIQPTSTGFNVTGNFGNSTTSIYIAIRRGPMKTPTSGTSVFNTNVEASGVSQTLTTGFPVDLNINTLKSSAADRYWIDRLRSGGNETGYSYLVSDTTAAEVASGSSTSTLRFDNNTGIVDTNYWATAGATFWSFARAPGFFDEVCYTSASGQVNHNLGVSPELVIYKTRSSPAASWYICAATNGFGDFTNAAWAGLGNGSGLGPNLANVTSTTIANGSIFYGNGYNIVTYLFASCPGVSKVGSYTGTGATQTINCGFTGGARFVLIKRTDSTGDWYVWDTARGMTSGTDPYLLLNSTAAEVNANNVYTTSVGFQIVGTGAGINASGGTYIYLAIA